MEPRALRRWGVAALAVPTLALTLAVAPAGAAPSPTAPDAFSAEALEPDGTVTAGKSASSRLARTPDALLERSDGDPVNVVIKLDYDAVASYAGGVDGLAATSPRVTGRKLTGATPAERAYGRHVAALESDVVADLAAAVPALEVGQSLRTVYGGVSAVIPAAAVEDVLAVDGVVAVQLDELRQPLTDASPAFVNAPPVYTALGGPADAGAGVIYGNLDSGVWPEHPSFADLGNLDAPPGPARECDFGDNPLTAETDVFACQNKLIGGAAFLDTYLDSPARAAAEPFHTARDSDGHGTHTASTTAGNVVDSAEVFGVERGPVQGIAPGAWVMEYKVCGVQGCFDSDSAAAVGQAITDGVDVINFSISGGTDPFTDPVELAFLDAYAAGVFVSTSAGNDGPGASTANHLSPWVTSVAASTQTREFATTLELDAGGATFTVDGASITAGAGPRTVVMSSAAPYSDPLCLRPAPAGTFQGVIVACQRGQNARVDKGHNVLQGGAEGMILYNPTLQDNETDSHWLPTVHLADGTDFVAFMTTHAGETIMGSFAAGEARDGQGDVMAAFSSRGPAGLTIKPDLTAPGVQILAGDTPVMETITSGPAGEYFQAIAGTSMSSPHVAGAGALLMAAHPNWTPGQVRSALMTTAVTDVVKEDLTTPADPFDMGSGRIDVGAAAAAVLTLDETEERFLALGGSELTAIDLNIPSINAPTMPGSITTTRTVTNHTSTIQKIDVTTAAPEGTSITVTPAKFNVLPGRSQTLTVTIAAAEATGEQQFGSILLTPKGRGGALHLPVAFVPTQGAISLSQSCDPASIAVGGLTECTVEAVNNTFDEQAVDLTTTVNQPLLLRAAAGAVLTGPRSATAQATLAGAALGVPDVAPGASPAGGYLALSLFGIAPTVVGDEDIVNFSVPAFEFAGQTWNTLGVDSNGYLVVGGGTSEDNNCCNLPAGPDPAPPNNVLAPFWTDLDGTGAPGIYAGTLTDGVNTWLVIEHQVNVWGTTDLRSFQTWIGVNGVEDISFTYAAPQLDPAGQDFLVGAENALGQGDMEAVLPSVDLRVTSTDATPGGSLVYTVTAEGLRAGAGLVTTSMTAGGVPGTTVVRTPVEVTRR
ncbi:S8 family serine peptidase [Georgenia sp. M64]|uniref:S8 family serine peptidase n=1 Tax=Georgenia sp. M64 TaxID=3120520 RepID=UPI0030DDEF65